MNQRVIYTCWAAKLLCFIINANMNYFPSSLRASTREKRERQTDAWHRASESKTGGSKKCISNTNSLKATRFFFLLFWVGLSPQWLAGTVYARNNSLFLKHSLSCRGKPKLYERKKKKNRTYPVTLSSPIYLFHGDGESGIFLRTVVGNYIFKEYWSCYMPTLKTLDADLHQSCLGTLVCSVAYLGTSWALRPHGAVKVREWRVSELKRIKGALHERNKR